MKPLALNPSLSDRLRPRWLVRGAAVGLGLLASGCAQVGYFGQSVGGHLGLVAAARPVPDWLADPATPPALRERLALSQRLRDFASSELGLPDNASYRRYADLRRAAAVWNVVATPELSLQLKTWCYPVVGCVGYRGYFDEAAAHQAAAPLRSEGLEVQVYGVPAYSTLGKLPGSYFADPLLNTFVNYQEVDLARLIFHELAHQVAYAADDTTFNESFATAVERLGSERWLKRQTAAAGADSGAGVREAAALADARREDFRDLTQRTRQRLDVLYRSPASDAEKRAGKARVMADMRAAHDALKADRWGGHSGYDGWFARANNASLALVAAYNAQVPAFERLFEREGGDFPRFYTEARRLAALPPTERRAALAVLAP
jgi:predicted aminopeptidase